MRSPANPQPCLSPLVAALLVIGCLSTSASAATFQFRHPVVGLVSSPTAAKAPDPVTEIVMALTGGPALPIGELNWPYSFDLKQLLSVTGDPAYSSTNVTWSLASGTLPAGLSLGSDGVISGTPTAKNAAGSNFQVLASYKTKSGQQAFTLAVNGEVLHVTQISAGYQHTCAVTTTGAAKCWGLNGYGQLGDGTKTTRVVPTPVTGLTSGVVSISAGYYHTCAVTTSGGVTCWGENDYGGLGIGNTTGSTVPVNVPGVAAGVAQVAAGHSYSCAVLATGDVKCWGANAYGQVGDNTLTNQLSPKTTLISGVTQISTGHALTCAVTNTGGAKCWGLNNYGQLGDGTATTRKVPTDVQGLTSNVAAIATGYTHACAVTTGGAAKCWGLNTSGELGDATFSNKSSPVTVSGLATGIASIATGYAHTCAVTTAGGAVCWGYNVNGQVGNGTTGSYRNTPVAVSGLSQGVVAITASSASYHSCVKTNTGAAKCWGKNTDGELGNNSIANSAVPVDVQP